jgi:hypothetical protein
MSVNMFVFCNLTDVCVAGRSVLELQDTKTWLHFEVFPEVTAETCWKSVWIQFHFEEEDLGNGILCDMESPGYRGN